MLRFSSWIIDAEVLGSPGKVDQSATRRCRSCARACPCVVTSLRRGPGSDDGDYTAVLRWRWRWFLPGLTAPWAHGGAEADEPARKHGHRGLHVRDAARRCALGIHLEGRRGRDLQTLPGVTGRWSVSSAIICHIKPVNCKLTFVRLGRKVAQRGLKVQAVRVFFFFYCVSLSEKKNNKKKQIWWEKTKFGAVHFCARWPCFGARFLGTLIWSRPRERERVWSWRQRDLLSLRESLTARREVHIKTEDFLIGERKDNWKQAKIASNTHRLGNFATSWVHSICLTCNKQEEKLLCTDLIFRKHICLEESSVCCNLHVSADCNFSFMTTCRLHFTPGQPVAPTLSWRSRVFVGMVRVTFIPLIPWYSTFPKSLNKTSRNGDSLVNLSETHFSLYLVEGRVLAALRAPPCCWNVNVSLKLRSCDLEAPADQSSNPASIHTSFPCKDPPLGPKHLKLKPFDFYWIFFSWTGIFNLQMSS